MRTCLTEEADGLFVVLFPGSAAEQAKRAALAPVTEAPLTPEEEAEAIGEDDVTLEEDSRSHTDLLRETLGAQIITEEPN